MINRTEAMTLENKITKRNILLYMRMRILYIYDTDTLYLLYVSMCVSVLCINEYCSRAIQTYTRIN